MMLICVVVFYKILAKALPIASQHQNMEDQRRRASVVEVIEREKITSKERKFSISILSQAFILINISFYLFARVSPEESRDESTAASSSNRRGKSAPQSSVGTEVISRHIMDKVAPDGGVQSPPDPLEPWSTRDIKSINNILDNSDRE
jgi:hypothetical protein